MYMQNRFVKWYIKKIVIPQSEIFDYPGFVVSKFKSRGKIIYVRHNPLPEYFIVYLENIISEKYGQKGEHILYSTGKKATYEYCMALEFLNINTAKTKEELMKFTRNIVRYEEAAYYKNIKASWEYSSKLLNVSFDEYFGCRKNGRGYIFTWAAPTAIWAYVLADPTIEGVQIKCIGIGNDRCEIVAAPPEILKKMRIKFYKDADMSDVYVDKREIMINKIRDIQCTKPSIRKLIKQRYIKYDRSLIERNKEKYILTETRMIYYIENYIRKLPNGNKIIFDAAFAAGKRIAVKESSEDYIKFTEDILTAFGYGNVCINKISGKFSVTFEYFPWHRFAESIKFSYWRGLLSGILSIFSGRKVRIRNLKKDVSDKFTLTFSE